LIVLDTSVVLAFMNRGDRRHEEVAAWVDRLDDDLVTTPLAVAEMDHLVSRSGGQRAAHRLRADLSSGAYAVAWWPEALAETLAVAERHESFPLGLTDASLVALAAHLETTAVATLDERHFRTVRPLGGEAAFTLLPSDKA
jgi:predicted nucleic acid-binding protein